MNDTLKELVETLSDKGNVLSVTFSNDTELWTIEYRDGLEPTEVGTEDLIDFLKNG